MFFSKKVLFCVWHSLIGSGIITNDRKREIDTYVLIGSSGIFLFYNLFYIFWFLRMYKSIKKFHNFSVNEAQNAAKKKHEFEMLNETTAARVSTEASKQAFGGSVGDNNNSSGGQQGSSLFIKKSAMTNSRKSRETRERDSSPCEPVRSKNQTAINFTDLPKP